jgi:hypothetical protein
LGEGARHKLPLKAALYAFQFSAAAAAGLCCLKFKLNSHPMKLFEASRCDDIQLGKSSFLHNFITELDCSRSPS